MNHNGFAIMPESLLAPRRIRMYCSTRSCLLACAFFSAAMFCSTPLFQAQAVPASHHQNVGDAPATALPLAQDVSAKLTHRDVQHALRKVADWQLNRAEADFDQDWTYAALYVGFMAVPDTAGGKEYRAAMLRMGKKFDWQ